MAKKEKKVKKEEKGLKELRKKHKIEEKEQLEKEKLKKKLEKIQKELEDVTGEEIRPELAAVERQTKEIRKLRKELEEEKPKNSVNFIFVLISFIAFLGVLAIPETTIIGLSVAGQRALAIFVLVFILWITESIPLPVTALLPGALLVLLGLQPEPTEAFKTYAHPAVFFIIGSLIIAHALVQSGLARRISYSFISFSRGKPHLLLLLLIATSTSFSMFVSDHLMAALLVPVVLILTGLLKISNDNFRTALLLGVVFGAGTGGLATPSGGARNVIALGLLQEITGLQITYLDWMKAALPLALLMIPVIWIVLSLMFPFKRISFSKIIEEVESHVKPLNRTQWKTLAVFAITIILFIFTSDLIGLGTVAILGAIFMFFAGSLTWDEARKSIPWGIMFIYGAAITMGISLMETGAANWIAQGFLRYFSADPFSIIFGVILISILLTSFMSDGATSSILSPITITLALLAGFNPRVFALATAIPATFSFLTVFATPPNLIAYQTGYVKMRNFFLAGLPIVIIASILLYLSIKYYWPLIGFGVV